MNIVHNVSIIIDSNVINNTIVTEIVETHFAGQAHEQHAD